MAVIAVNAPGRRIGNADLVRAATDRLAPGATVAILVHGYRSSPYAAHADPHRRVLKPARGRTHWKDASWPHYLHVGRGGPELAIGFGWPALGRLDRAAERAFAAGEAMGAMIAGIARDRPDLRLDVVAHSLGARVALTALESQAPGALDTLVLMTGAEYRGAAERAAFSPAGQSARILNVTSGENALFEGLFRLFAPGPDLLSRQISAGLSRPHPGWIDLRIDDPAHLSALRGLGHRVGAPTGRVCHWSAYLRPGLFPLYRELFGPDGARAFARLRAALPARDAAPARAFPALRGGSGVGLRA
ncbi:alpha/beta hydrolase [Rhodobacterales bacterium HKCCE2091]|nr:alpha/beta hydrolase [Rhodobacterales bacterium HKCCE2091]